MSLQIRTQTEVEQTFPTKQKAKRCINRHSGFLRAVTLSWLPTYTSGRMLSTTPSTRTRTLLFSLAIVYLTARTRMSLPTGFLKSTVSQLNTNVNLRKLKTSNYFEIAIVNLLITC